MQFQKLTPNLVVRDVAASMQFYKTVLGFQPAINVVLEEIRAGKYDSAFWRFARQLGQAAAGEAEIDDLQNVVWTNICKLTDVYCGNPRGKLLAAQAELAIQTLREEIRAYEPKAAIFLSDQYADIIRQIVNDMNDTGWHREDVTS